MQWFWLFWMLWNLLTCSDMLYHFDLWHLDHFVTTCHNPAVRFLSLRSKWLGDGCKSLASRRLRSSMVNGGRPPMHTGAILAKTCSLNWLLRADYSHYSHYSCWSCHWSIEILWAPWTVGMQSGVCFGKETNLSTGERLVFLLGTNVSRR